MSEESIANSLATVAEAIKREAMGKGSLSPCPFCKTPRHERSVYVRCNPCGLNWELGADLNKHPRASNVVSVAIATTKTPKGQ